MWGFLFRKKIYLGYFGCYFLPDLIIRSSGRYQQTFSRRSMKDIVVAEYKGIDALKIPAGAAESEWYDYVRDIRHSATDWKYCGPEIHAFLLTAIPGYIKILAERHPAMDIKKEERFWYRHVCCAIS